MGYEITMSTSTDSTALKGISFLKEYCNESRNKNGDLLTTVLRFTFSNFYLLRESYESGKLPLHFQNYTSLPFIKNPVS